MKAHAAHRSRRDVPVWGLLLKSLALFVGTLAASITYLLHPASLSLQRPLEAGLARAVGAILSPFYAVQVSGSSLRVEGFAVEIIPACTGLFTLAIFLSAVVAYPTSLRAKLAGAGLGVGLLLPLNGVRVLSLVLIGLHVPSAFEFAHLVVWQSLVIFAAAVLWLYWVARYAQVRT